MKLGIGTYAFMWAIGFKFGDREARPDRPMTAFDLLRRTHELGLHVAQYGPNLPLSALSTAELDTLVAQAKEWDVDLEIGTRGLETDHLLRQVELARKVGSGLVRTIPELGTATPSLEEMIAHLKAILPALEENDVLLGLENGKVPALDLKTVLEASEPSTLPGRRRLGIVLDMVNSMVVPEGWRYVTEILAPYTICLHFKDFMVERVWHMMGYSVQGCPAGQGFLDTPWLLDVLESAGATVRYGRPYNVILELWPPEQASVTETIALEDKWAQESVRHLRRYIKD